MYYVYILKNRSKPGAIYKGFTTDLKERFKQHNDPSNLIRGIFPLLTLKRNISSLKNKIKFMLFMRESKNKKWLFFVFGALLAAGIFLAVFAGSARINSFEECEKAGWLIRERIVYSLAYEGSGQIEKECVLWSGKRFVKLTE